MGVIKQYQEPVSVHAKYEVSISYGSKVTARVKFTTDRQTYKQTRPKQYAPNHLIRGHKKLKINIDHNFERKEIHEGLSYIYLL